MYEKSYQTVKQFYYNIYLVQQIIELHSLHTFQVSKC